MRDKPKGLSLIFTRLIDIAEAMVVWIECVAWRWSGSDRDKRHCVMCAGFPAVSKAKPIEEKISTMGLVLGKKKSIYLPYTMVALVSAVLLLPIVILLQSSALPA